MVRSIVGIDSFVLLPHGSRGRHVVIVHFDFGLRLRGGQQWQLVRRRIAQFTTKKQSDAYQKEDSGQDDRCDDAAGDIDFATFQRGRFALYNAVVATQVFRSVSVACKT